MSRIRDFWGDDDEVFDDEIEDFDDEYNDDCDFAEPGGISALRAATASNPRNQPCPNCGWPDRLTPRDVSLGYQCNSCADAVETGREISYYEGE